MNQEQFKKLAELKLTLGLHEGSGQLHFQYDQDQFSEMNSIIGNQV